MNRIYLDNQSTSFLKDEVIEAINEALNARYANPASQHEFGRIGRRKIESLRDTICVNLDLDRHDRCLFTSGGTESNNLALLGHFPTSGDWSQTNLVCSAIEHPSIFAVLDQLKSRHIEIRMVNPDSNGVVDPEKFGDLMDENTRLVCCMLANNETGVIQPVDQIASLCVEKNVPFHVDAVQAIGKVPFSFRSLGCSSATVSAHKFHGPTGIGLLLMKEQTSLSPLIFGGFQQEGIRPGTENIPLAAGLSRALELAIADIDRNNQLVSGFRDRFESRLSSSIQALVINGIRSNRLPNATNISFPGMDRQRFILAADLAGIACSTGSACSSGSSQPSHVLTAMGCQKELIESSIRFGFSSLNRIEEIDEAADRIIHILSQKMA